MSEQKCLCIRCCDERRQPGEFRGMNPDNFRFGCEICGNKRCPHHTDHNLPCTGSNEPGQPGSVYQ